jgi:hypothetical protein
MGAPKRTLWERITECPRDRTRSDAQVYLSSVEVKAPNWIQDA